ncbi:hypothetical protein R1sor_007008 [Riccia sorocarpa]|uniref:Uncharacterized protein n=1 Tax=Riccia sorocarpa TaxID=122646 RepID=A0ABD3HSQ5_9MARC
MSHECVSEDHTIKVTTVDNTPVTANTSGGSPNRRPTSQECVSDHQTAQVTTVDEVPITANTSRTSSHSSQVAQIRFARYEYATSASVTQDSATSASATQEYATRAFADQKNEATSASATQKDDPESAPATQNYVRQSASPTSSLNDSKTNVGDRATSTSSHGCDSRKGTDYFYSFQCCLFSSLVSKQKDRGRGRAGSTPAKQRTHARPRTSRRAAPKQPAPLPINPNNGQDNEDDEMAEVWRDFAVVQAQTKAKKNEQREKEEHEQFVKFAKLREEKQIENWRAMDASDRKKRKPQPRLMQWSDEDLCAYYERIERQKKEEKEKRRRRLVHKRKYFPVIYRNRVAKVIWYHEFYRRLEIEVTIKRLKKWVELKVNPEPSEDEDSNKKNG